MRVDSAWAAPTRTESPIAVVDTNAGAGGGGGGATVVVVVSDPGAGSTAISVGAVGAASAVVVVTSPGWMTTEAGSLASGGEAVTTSRVTDAVAVKASTPTSSRATAVAGRPVPTSATVSHAERTVARSPFRRIGCSR